MAESLHPFLDLKDTSGKVPHCWAGGQWIVYLNSLADILRAIRYVEDNPTKDGLPRQRWPFVVPYPETPV